MRRFERAVICLVLAACAVASPSPVPDQSTSRNIQMAPAVHAANAIYSNSWALVIGINQYQEVPRLQYAVADATSVAAALKGLGFPSENTFVLADGQATREAIRKVLEGTIRRRAEPTDRLFILFSGHGVTETLPGGGEEGWLVPVDGDPNDLPLTAISMTDLKSLFKRLPPKHTMLVVDACYGGYTISKAAPPGTYDAGYLERLTRERVVRVLTAGSKNERVVEEGGHGILTAKLLKGLSGLADMNGDGLIPAMELFAWLDPLVVRDSGSQQKPVFGSLDGEGEFVFVVGAPVPEVPAVAPSGASPTSV